VASQSESRAALYRTLTWPGAPGTAPSIVSIVEFSANVTTGFLSGRPLPLPPSLPVFGSRYLTSGMGASAPTRCAERVSRVHTMAELCVTSPTLMPVA
jgi:hypothetical protein